MYRQNGAYEAWKLGALASLIRSVTPFSLGTPHTGSQSAQSNDLIPSGAITVEDAAMLQSIQDSGVPITLSLYMEAHNDPLSLSHNIVAQINGTTHPEQLIVIGGHIDSWDVGTGAQDDGGGVVACWEAMRILKSLNLTMQRTVRFVAWTNEENGRRGADQYDLDHADEAANTILALESDTGIFTPFSFAYGDDSSEEGWRWLNNIFTKYIVGTDLQLQKVTKGASAVDITPLKERGIPIMTLTHANIDKYFWCLSLFLLFFFFSHFQTKQRYHHTFADEVANLNQSDLQRASAAIAYLVYMVSETAPNLRK